MTSKFVFQLLIRNLVYYWLEHKHSNCILKFIIWLLLRLLLKVFLPFLLKYEHTLTLYTIYIQSHLLRLLQNNNIVHLTDHLSYFILVRPPNLVIFMTNVVKCICCIYIKIENYCSRRNVDDCLFFTKLLFVVTIRLCYLLEYNTVLHCYVVTIFSQLLLSTE